MKKIIKGVVSFIILAAILFVSVFIWVLALPDPHLKITPKGDIRYVGRISFKGYQDLVSLYEGADISDKPRTLVIRSKGGNALAGILIGRFIHEHALDVRVRRYCMSACANYVFPSGERKVLTKNAVVVYHGGFSQDNLLDKVMLFIRSKMSGQKYIDKNQGREASIHSRRSKTSTSEETLSDFFPFLSECEIRFTPGKEYRQAVKGCLDKEVAVETAFFENLGINKDLPYIGQRGIYEGTYKSYSYIGFIYHPDVLADLGVKNVVVRKGWDPSANRYYSKVYAIDSLN